MKKNKRKGKILSRSAEETIRAGKEFCKNLLLRPSGSRACVVFLEGDLGAGKTTFVRGVFHALGVRRRVPSPTFIIMRKTRVPGKKRFQTVYHIDAYRIQNAREIGSLGISDILMNPTALILVEWPERMKNIFPRTRLRVRFAHGKTEHERIISVMNSTHHL